MSQDLIRFGSMMMRTEETKDIAPADSYFFYDIFLGGEISSLSGGSEAIYVDSVGDKVTMLISITTDNTASLVGKTLYLTLQGLRQFSYLEGKRVGMESDLRKSGYMYDNATSATEFSYKLITDSGKQVPLAKELSEYQVTNAGIKNGVLYLRGTAPTPANAELFENPRLWNPETGEYLSVSAGGTSDGDTGQTVWTFNVEGVETAESLRGFVLTLHAGYGLHLLREGMWEFTIPLDYENTSRVFHLEREFTVGGYTMAATELTVSPYYVGLKARAEPGTLEKMLYREHPITVEWSPIAGGETAWDKVDETAVITMKDGAEIVLPMNGGGTAARGMLP